MELIVKCNNKYIEEKYGFGVEFIKKHWMQFIKVSIRRRRCVIESTLQNAIDDYNLNKVVGEVASIKPLDDNLKFKLTFKPKGVTEDKITLDKLSDSIDIKIFTISIPNNVGDIINPPIHSMVDVQFNNFFTIES